jgi:ABC-type uncharacterized transport system permease subunit
MAATFAKSSLLRIAPFILALAILALVAQHATQNAGSTSLDELDKESDQLLRRFGSD